MSDTFTTLWNRVQLRVPAAGPDLCQDLIRDAFNQFVERRQWSWLTNSGAFYPASFTVTGTVNLTSGSTVVTGLGTNFSQAMVSMQIRIAATASSYPTYTISRVNSATNLILDDPWTGPSLTGQSYTVFQCYFTVPADFKAFYSVINPANAYQLNFNATQAELNIYDPQRANSGLAYALAFYDYTQNYAGTVAQPLQVHGTGAVPTSQTTNGYSYPIDSIYSVEITTGGASGTAVCKWQQEAGITAGNSLLTSSAPATLSNGVQIAFPAVGTYNLGDVFVISCKADAVSGVPRYEMWPRPVGAPSVYPYIYITKLPPLTDDEPALPPVLAGRGDVLIEMAMTNLSLWPGTNNQPNPYRDPSVSLMHRDKAEKLIYELEKNDNDVVLKDLTYDYPYMGPWGDGSWLQTHAVYSNY